MSRKKEQESADEQPLLYPNPQQYLYTPAQSPPLGQAPFAEILLPEYNPAAVRGGRLPCLMAAFLQSEPGPPAYTPPQAVSSSLYPQMSVNGYAQPQIAAYPFHLLPPRTGRNMVRRSA